MTTIEMRAALHFLEDNGIKPTSWKLTDKSLVWYDRALDFNDIFVPVKIVRRVLPIPKLMAWYDTFYGTE